LREREFRKTSSGKELVRIERWGQAQKGKKRNQTPSRNKHISQARKEKNKGGGEMVKGKRGGVSHKKKGSVVDFS